jgi:hypothetical protein
VSRPPSSVAQDRGPTAAAPPADVELRPRGRRRRGSGHGAVGRTGAGRTGRRRVDGPRHAGQEPSHTNQVLPAQGIAASETSACVRCTLSQACPLFPAALSALHTSFPSEPCAPLSPKVTVVRISATEVRFSAPAGVTVLPTGTGETSGGGSYPVQGVRTWSLSTQHGACTSTCTLPASSASVCGEPDRLRRRLPRGLTAPGRHTAARARGLES